MAYAPVGTLSGRLRVGIRVRENWLLPCGGAMKRDMAPAPEASRLSRADYASTGSARGEVCPLLHPA